MIKKVRTKLIGERCILMTTFGDKIRELRKEKYELPPEAIREMIINAHCHRNLLDESCIQVAVYDDRLEVTSPGGLYNGLTYEEVMNGHSKIRNKGIANIFSQMGLVEAYSTFEGYAFHLK